jgi:hypothetical protein
MRFSNEVKHRVKKYPDDIHEVPVESGYFNGRVVFYCKPATLIFFDHPTDHADSNDEMKSVDGRHDIVKKKENLHMFGCIT